MYRNGQLNIRMLKHDMNSTTYSNQSFFGKKKGFESNLRQRLTAAALEKVNANRKFIVKHFLCKEIY